MPQPILERNTLDQFKEPQPSGDLLGQQDIMNNHHHTHEVDQPDHFEVITRDVDPASVDGSKLEDLIDLHPAAKELAERLRETRGEYKLPEQKDREYVENIKSVRQEIGQQIMEKLGIAEEDDEVKARRQETERLQSLGRVLTSLTHEETDDELMAKYHLVDENGGMTAESMNSPLFTAETRRAFERYMKFAAQFDAMEQAEAFNGSALKNTKAASNLRGEAHNYVATLVEADLGLPFDAARRFVAKAREARVPGLHEKINYASLLRGEKLADKFGHDAAAFTRTSLQGMINKPMDHESDPNNS